MATIEILNADLDADDYTNLVEFLTANNFNWSEVEPTPSSPIDVDFTGEITKAFLNYYEVILKSADHSSAKQEHYAFFKAGWEARQGDAVEFAEWMKENQIVSAGERHWVSMLPLNPNPLTTEQLYQLFLTSKNK